MFFDLPIRARKVGIVLAVIAVYLTVQSIFGEYVQATLLSTKLDSIPAIVLDDFSVNAEGSIPNWYSATILLIAAALLGLIAISKYRSNAPYRVYWAVLAIIFVYLSIDEGAAIHEIFSDPIHSTFNTSGLLEFGWQLAAAPALIIFGLMYVRLLLHLPSLIRNMLIFAGVIYIGGAFVGDAIQANQLSLDGGATLSLPYLTIGSVEELMEMIGITLLIYTLLLYMEQSQYTYTFHLQGTHTPLSLISNTTAIRGRTKRLVIGSIVIILLFNIGLLYWGITMPIYTLSSADYVPLPAYSAIIAQYPAADMTITRVRGVFGTDSQIVRGVTLSMLNTFNQVMVISLPTDQSSIVLAGNMLPFDRDTLASLLRANGETQFIIYETSAVKAVLGKVQ